MRNKVLDDRVVKGIKRISMKIMFAIMICSVATAILLCGVNIEKSTSVLEEEAKSTLTFASEKYANQFSAIFKNTEGMVDAIAANVSVTFDTEKNNSDIFYFQEYKEYLNHIIQATILNGEAAHGLYFTYAPDLTAEEQEVWYAYDDRGKLNPVKADLHKNKRDFTKPNQASMQYYFQPIIQQKGTWTGPYFDSDVSLNMISYSKPVYVNQELIGVAGADILTKDTIDLVETMKIYKGSYSFLLDENLHFIVGSEGKEAEFIKSGNVAGLKKQIQGRNSGVAFLTYQGKKTMLAFSHLSNGWVLGIAQPTEQVYVPIKMLSSLLAWITVFAIVATVIFAVVFSKRFSKPILRVSDQLKYLKSGDYTHPIPDELLQRKDDLGEFATGISAIQKAIEQEAEKNREKDVLLIYQSKQAKIGEMVGNISHQWKQPLNNINLILLNLYDAYLYRELDDKTMKEGIEKAARIVKNMSVTIEDFTNFLRPNREMAIFEVQSSVTLALDLMEASIKYNEISVDVDVDEGLLLYGFPNEFSHVLFNVLNNARDAVLESGIEDKRIVITGKKDGESVVLEVRNRGNRIPNEIMNHVFEPYMTTKSEKEGTGIGLYISKLIIERMGGQIVLMNVTDGVSCKITLKNRQRGEKWNKKI